MKIEWAYFVQSAEGEAADVIIGGPGGDNLLAECLPVEVKIKMVVALRTEFQEFTDPVVNVLRAEILEPSERKVVNRMEWTMSPPTVGAELFQEGRGVRQIRPLPLEFPADIAGWYDVELSLNDGEIYLIQLRVALETDAPPT
jgi:hypothetical protein